MTSKKVFLAALLLISVSIFGNGNSEGVLYSTTEELDAISVELQDAAYTSNVSELQTIREKLLELSKDNTRSDYGAVLYHLGMTDTELLENSFDNKTINVDTLIDEGQQALELAVKITPKHSDTHRALSTFYGIVVGIKGGSSGANLSSKMSKATKKALKLDPNNALAHMEQASSYYYTPKMWGGDLEKAETSIIKSLELDPNNPDGFVYYGLILDAQGRNAEAISKLEEGLKLHPEYGELLRNLEEVKKKK